MSVSEEDGDIEESAAGPNNVPKAIAQAIPALASSQTGDSSVQHQQAREVIDADEEIFLLYTLSAAEADRRGLGQIDAAHDALCFDIDWSDVKAGAGVATMKVSLASEDDDAGDARGTSKSRRGKMQPRKARGASIKQQTSLSVTLRQDSTSLRTTTGDTGSVIWRSSVSLAAKLITDVVRESLFTARDHRAATTVLWASGALGKSRILELGAGTGVLPCLLLACPHLQTSDRFHWLATDQEAMLGLLQRNIKAACAHHTSAPASVGALDWIEASQLYRRGTPSAVEAFLKQLFSSYQTRPADEDQRPDVIVATDCIFNPSLFSAFVDTLNLITVPAAESDSAPSPTLVVVVCELRAPDALQAFVEQWLARGHRGEQWRIFTMEDTEVLGPFLRRGSVVWAAWRKA